MRAALDTNVFISGLNYSGAEYEVVMAALRDRFELVLPEIVLQELSDVLARKFAWGDQEIEPWLTKLRQTGDVVATASRVSVIEGQDADNQILACAVEHGTDYLVTGDRKHLLPLEEFEGVKIVRAPEFLALLSSDD